MAMPLRSVLCRASKTRFSAQHGLKHLCGMARWHQSVRWAESWQLMTAICLQRLPVITTRLKPLEAEYQQLLNNQELEESLLSDHELRHIEDLRLAELRKKDDYEETEADAVRQTTMELEDLWENELHTFKPASRLTDADKNNDEKWSGGRLESQLVLAVKQRLGDKTHWLLPMGKWLEGESMRQAAERTLYELCGSELQTRFMGNAPVGFYKYRFPPDQQTNGKVGAKIFFFQAQLQGGSVKEVKEPAEDYLWLTKDELLKQMSPRLAKTVNRFILNL